MSTILVIDDDPGLRCAVRVALAAAGHAVLEAETVRAGTERALEYLPDLIICDLHLEGGSGLEVLQKLRQGPMTASLPLILITGSSDETVMRTAMDLGADDFLRKPFSADQLRATVAARLKRQEMLKARAEQALKESEARFRAIATAALDGILMIDPKGAITFWNEAAAGIFGFAPAEALGADLAELALPETARDRYLDALPFGQDPGNGKDPGRVIELLARRKDGSMFPAEFSLAPVTIHGRCHAVGIVRDMSRQRQADEQLRTLSKAVEQSPASVVITDTLGNIQYVNPKFCAVTGYTRQEVQGQNPRVLKSGETPGEEYARLWQALVRGQDWRGEVHNRRKNGELYWEFAVISPIKDEAGTITHFLAVKEDITDRKRAEHECAIMELHLRQAQKLESIGQLAAGIAHEINTPMQYLDDNTQFLGTSFGKLSRVVSACQEVIARHQGSPGTADALAPLAEALGEADAGYLVGEIPKAIEESRQGIERVTHIVQAMKEFSHPGTDQKSAVDLNHAIESTLIVARNEYKYLADVETDLDPALPLVPCLPGEFNQILLNLIVNAAHAIAEMLGPTPAHRGRITLSSRKAGDFAEIRVTDTGPGIPDAVQARIFDPFFTTKPVGKGSGQGLAIARSVVVDKHGGSITFETASGQGTTFIVRLPLADPPAASPAPVTNSLASVPDNPHTRTASAGEIDAASRDVPVGTVHAV